VRFDSIDVAWSVLEKGLADHVLTAGVVGNVFLIADGVDLGDASSDFIYDQGYWDEIDRAADLLDAYGDRIALPATLPSLGTTSATNSASMPSRPATASPQWISASRRWITIGESSRTRKR